MMPKALVIDDDTLLLDNVARRLDQIGHTCHCVGTVDLARASLHAGHDFDYVLLDLELPFDAEAIPDKQNGLNLLGAINRIDPELPVVVMTAHDHDSSDLSAEVMRHGRAVDYVRKPFPSPPTRHQTLEAAAKQACARRLEHNLSREAPVKAFEGGVLSFHDDRVELLGVTICGDDESGLMRRILDRLAGAHTGNTWRIIKGDRLAELTGAADAGSISSTVSNFRRRVAHLFMQHLRVTVAPDSIVRSNKDGYALASGIRVDGAVPSADAKKNGVPADADGLNKRQRSIADLLKAGTKLRKGDICDKFSVSDRTAKRDLCLLRERGLAEFVGHGTAGAWSAPGHA